MTQADLKELEAAAKDGALTKTEQRRILRELRAALTGRAGYYADLVKVREELKVITGETTDVAG